MLTPAPARCLSLYPVNSFSQRWHEFHAKRIPPQIWDAPHLTARCSSLPPFVYIRVSSWIHPSPLSRIQAWHFSQFSPPSCKTFTHALHWFQLTRKRGRSQLATPSTRNERQPVIPAKHPPQQPQPTAASRPRAAHPQPSLPTRQPRCSLHYVPSPRTHTAFVAFSRPNVAFCKPNVALCHPKVNPIPALQHPVTSDRPNILSRRRKKILKKTAIGRHWTTSIPYRYPARPLHRRRPCLQPSAPQPTNRRNPPSQRAQPSRPAPATANSPARTQPPSHRPPRPETANSRV